MSEDCFDPFNLPATFDPLAPVAPAPPRRRRAAAAAAPAAEAVPGRKAGGGPGGRLAHLLRPRSGEADGSSGASGADARIIALETRLAMLTARIEGLEASLASGLDGQRERLLQGVTGRRTERGARRSRGDSGRG